jgi:predicted CXXCH cytochrome family protein
MFLFSRIIVILFATIFVKGTELSALPLDGTKHDLSSAGTGTYKAASNSPALGGTTEKCIFCHTPHSGNTEAPLWNRANSTATYQTYTSDVLSGFGYPSAEDPSSASSPGFVVHAKTRICLSCHDGTIALGSVVNMPSNIPGSYSEIQMSGSSKIQPNAAGYIGVNLRDDHPVAIKHDSSLDTELVSGASVGSSVRLYENVGGRAVVSKKDGSYVECTSCHNPHDNRFGNFLVETNQYSALCLRCHTKTGFTNSIHNVSPVSYSPPTGGTPANLGSTVGGVKCMNTSRTRQQDQALLIITALI